MAIYHLSVKTISRSAGRSATAAAAYRSGAQIVDERTGERHDYERRSGVVASWLALPDDAPVWASDRAALWNAAEAAERRKNSTVAREIVVALPSELFAEQRAALVAEFAREVVAEHGVAVDVAVHAPGREGDRRNHHAHLLLSTRVLEPRGFGAKTRQLDDRSTGPEHVRDWRAGWAQLANAHLERAGSEARIDHRSLEAQGIDREPGVHLGPRLSAYERREKQASARTATHAERALDQAHERREAKSAGAEVVDLSERLDAARAARDEQAARDAAEAAAAADAREVEERAAREREQATRAAAEQARREAEQQAEKQRAEEAERAGREAGERAEKRRLEEVERERAAAAAREADERAVREATERQLAAMTSAELRAAAERHRVPSVERMVAEDPALLAASEARAGLEARAEAAQAALFEAVEREADWRERHPVRARLHDAERMPWRERAIDAAQGDRATARGTLDDVAPLVEARHTESAARSAAIVAAEALEPGRELVAQLDALAAERAGEERRQQAEAQAEARQQARIRAAAAAFGERLDARDRNLANGEPERWWWSAATPETRELIDGARLANPSAQERAALVETLASPGTPEAREISERIVGVVEEQLQREDAANRAHEREQSRQQAGPER